jgi:ribonuclease VapC
MRTAQVIVDASVVLAILFDEPEGREMGELLSTTGENLTISPVNFLEAAVRVDRLGSHEKSARLDALLHTLRIEITPVTGEQAFLAREAYRRFGKGNDPAKLNLGDCFAYALAKARNEQLLFKGDDFRLTDVEAVL